MSELSKILELRGQPVGLPGLAAKTALQARRQPIRTVELPPTAWATEWPARPPHAVKVGLKLLSEKDVQQARSEASRQAWDYAPGDMGDEREEERINVYNDALVRIAVARGTTKPDDADQYLFQMAEDTVSMALTTDGIRHLWEALERMTIELGPLCPKLDDGEAQSLAAWLLAGRHAEAPDGLRRLLHHCHDELARV